MLLAPALAMLPPPPHPPPPVGDGAINGVTIISGGIGYSANPTVTITDDPTFCGGTLQPVCGSGATASAVVGNAAIVGFQINSGGAGYEAPVVTITDSTGTGALADAIIGGLVDVSSGIRKFVDTSAGARARRETNNLGPVHPGWGRRAVHL